MPNLTIKKLTSSDPIPWRMLLLTDPSKEKVREYLKLGETYVGFFKNEVVGVYALVDISPKVKELKNLGVDINYQNRGIGKKLVSHAVERAKSLGAERIEVGTGNSSLAQCAFYQRCGFRIVGVIKNYFTDNYKKTIMENGIQCRDMIRLVKELS